MRISKTVMAVGGVVVAAAAIGFTNPKTVHALAAALVQVTNTASNPVVTQGMAQQAGQIIHLRCTQDSYGGTPCVLLGGFNPSGAAYVVPANQSLVITSVDIFPTQIYLSTNCSVIHADGLLVSQGNAEYYAQTWAVNNVSVHYTYTSGIVIGAGLSVSGASAYFGTPPPASCYSSADYSDQFDVYGYLTAV